jgi:methionine-rich copper-binding protein CopC
MTRPFHVLRLGLALFVALALPVRSISAHPRLLRAVPAPESRLATAPREISLAFHEAVVVGLCRLTLLDATRHAVSLDSIRAVRGDAKTLTVKILGTMRPGRYTVKWQAGGVDGHPVRGEFSFVVDAGSVRPAKRSAPPVQADATTSLTGARIAAEVRGARR